MKGNGRYGGNAYNVLFYRQRHLKTDYKINNPRNVITKRFSTIKAFHQTLQETPALDDAGIHGSQGSDVVGSGGMIVFMVLASMNEIAQVCPDPAKP